MAKILSIEYTGKNMLIWAEIGTHYVRMTVPKKGEIQEREHHSISDYRGYEHFAGVLGKFNSYTRFLRDPFESDLTFGALLEAYKRLNVIEVGGN